MTDLRTRLPLRTQLLALILATVGLVVALTAVAGTVALRGYLLDRIDAQLTDGARAVMGPGGRDGMPFDDRPARRPALQGDYYVATYDESGTLVRAQTASGDAGPTLSHVDAARLGHAFTVGAWRALAVARPLGGSVVVALPLKDVQDTTRRLLVIDVLVGGLALLGAGALAWVGVRRSLRPLVEVETTAEAIAAGDLSVRVPVAGPRTEVGSLAASFNLMVDRFESAYRAQQQSEGEARASEDRMRRFVADASHELRTPLTSIRGFAELFRQGAVEDAARVLRRIEDEAARMGLLVEDLLLLARLDQQRPLERTPVDLLTVAADVVHDAQAVSSDHVVRLLPPEGDAPPVVVGDDARLRQVVGNLVANAVTHTPAGTTVEVVVGNDGSTVCLEVRDDGPGMAADVAARVFERFYRQDTSRTRTSTTTGSGLGLSIVAALVAAHGGRVSVHSAPGEGSAFRVELPA